MDRHEKEKADRRRFSRLKAEIPVICKVVDKDGNGKKVKTVCENISKKGLLMIWPKHIPEFEQTLEYLSKGKERRKSFTSKKNGKRKRFSRIELEIRPNQNRVKTYARICWGRKMKSSKYKYELGLCFLKRKNSEKVRTIPFSENFYWDIFEKSGSLPAFLFYRGRVS